MADLISEDVLHEMADYYRQRAGEYDEWFERKGRFDRGPALNARWFAEAQEVQTALAQLKVEGDVLELAPGTGIWTRQLLQTATTITAVDASPEMLAINRARLGNEKITYLQADLFSWQPERTYDAVCFGFWISHVPLERFPAFVAMVANALRSGGKVFFVDSRYEPSSTAVDHTLPGKTEQVMTRKLNDGRTFQIVKNFFSSPMLHESFARGRLNVRVEETPTYFIYGTGTKEAVTSTATA